MMDKKIEFGVIGAVITVAVIVCLMALMTGDNEGPVIRIDDEVQITYTEGQDKSVLLEGVTAYDKKDGNVTSSVRVESMFVSGDVLKVRYAAKDKHNNVTVADRYREVAYTAGSQGNTTQEEQGAAQNGSEAGQNERGDENGNSDGSQNAENPENAGEANGTENLGQESGQADNPTEENGGNITNATAEIDRAKVDETGVPVIRLTENEVTITEGASFNPLLYVWETYDDSGDVSRRIRISDDYDTDTEGDYTVTYIVSDEDGNFSEPAVLILHVQGE